MILSYVLEYSPIDIIWKYWWPGPESNWRHADFQSAALPTELPGQGCVF